MDPSGLIERLTSADVDVRHGRRPRRTRRIRNTRPVQAVPAQGDRPKLGHAGLDRSEKQRKNATASFAMNDETGMGYLCAELHPDDYQKIKRRLDAEINALRKLAENEGLDVRRHACTANIIPVVLGSDGQPLDVRRASRIATPAQRNALRSMYRTCAIEGCEHSFDRCEVHHIIEWAYTNGLTDLTNLLPLCAFQHHRSTRRTMATATRPEHPPTGRPPPRRNPAVSMPPRHPPRQSRMTWLGVRQRINIVLFGLFGLFVLFGQADS